MTSRPKRGFLAWMGIAFVGLIGLGVAVFGTLAWQASSASPANVRAAETAVRATAARWDFDDVKSLIDPRDIARIEAPARAEMSKWRRLGSLVRVETASQTFFISSVTGAGAIKKSGIELICQFENGRGKVTVGLQIQNDHTWVKTFNIVPIGPTTEAASKA